MSGHRPGVYRLSTDYHRFNGSGFRFHASPRPQGRTWHRIRAQPAPTAPRRVRVLRSGTPEPHREEPRAMTLKSHDLAHIRSVVLAGHAGGGKTTLAEQVLFRAGAIPRLGRVDDGTAHLDYEPEEQKQHRSRALAVGTFEHGEHEVTVVDTPGYPDFVAEVIEGFHAADAALFVMDASGHVEAGLENAVKTGRSTKTAA